MARTFHKKFYIKSFNLSLPPNQQGRSRVRVEFSLWYY